MIRYLKHNEIDFEQWDACMKQSPNALIYGYSWFLDMAADQWDALVLNEYDAVMPLPWRKKWGIQYLYQPEMMQQGGVFSRVSLNEELVHEFLNSIPKQFKLAEINLNYGNNFQHPYLNRKKNLILKLNDDIEIIHAAYSENTRRNIKKAEKEEFSVSESFDMKNIMHLFTENKGSELKISSHWEKRIMAISHALHYRGVGQTISLYNSKNQCVAGAFYVVFEQRVYFLFSGSGAEAKSHGAMHFLIHSLIKKFEATKYIFDFEGSNNDGLARFYSSFGATEQNYPMLIMSHLPFYMKLFKR